jgi:DNA polymerase-3 subunit gamma/tau
MAYLSLYRKYRSQSFEDVSGQEHVTRTLRNALKAGRVGHAYLFSGPRGTGKTSTARLLARALNCESGPTPDPCGECVQCHEIRDGISPSVVEIDAASSRGIDEIRDLRQRVMTVPSRAGARKVFIVDEVHMLTTEACNALLKTLEEPPAHVLFILATTDAQKLPATILSRCQRFEFRRGSISLIGERLRFVAEAEGFQLEPEAVRLIARASGGSWRDAISLLEQVLSYGSSEAAAASEGQTLGAAEVAAVLGMVGEESLLELGDGLAHADGGTVYPIVERLISAGTEPRQLARDLGEHFRALLLSDSGALPMDAYTPEIAERLAEQAPQFGTGRLVAALEALAQAEKEMRWSDSGRVVLEVALARLMLSSAAAPAVANGQHTAAREGTAARSATRPASRPADRVAESPAAPLEADKGAVHLTGRAAESLPRVPAKRVDGRIPLPEADAEAEFFRTPARGDAPLPVPPPLSTSLPQDSSSEESSPAAPPEEEPEFDPFEHEELPPALKSGGSRLPPPAAEPRRSEAPAPAAGNGQSEAPGPSPDGQISLARVRERWNVVVEELKRARAKKTSALLDEAQPQRCEGGVVVIGFRYDTHRVMWEREDHKQRLATALQAVLGQPFQVRTELIVEADDAEESGPPPPRSRSTTAAERATPKPAVRETPPVAAAGPSSPDMLEGEPLVREVIAVFDGKIVEGDERA